MRIDSTRNMPAYTIKKGIPLPECLFFSTTGFMQNLFDTLVSVYRQVAQFFFDAEQLVVFSHTVGTA